MMRKSSHSQKKEPFLEYVLSEIRFMTAKRYIENDSIVADLGCGYNGSFLKKISNKIKLGIGYDVSCTNKHKPKNIILKRADINKKINTNKNHFDTVIALAVIEHINNPQSFLKNIRGMLKNHGKLILSTPHKNGRFILEVILYKLGFISKDEINDHKNYYDKNTLARLIKRSGYKIIEIKSFGIAWLNIFCLAEKN